MVRHIIIAGLLVSILVAFSFCANDPAVDSHEEDASIASRLGWLDHYKNGERILSKLAALTPEASKQLPVDAYRDEKVAYVGGSARPGATNDLVTYHGYYIRVVNADNKDFRQGVFYSAIIFGKIIQVLPENKIIVIEVGDKDYIVLEVI